MKKRLLNLRNSWAVITEGKATNASMGTDQGLEVWVWVVDKSEATETRRLSQISMSLHRLFPLPEISAFSPLPQYVMFNINTSFKIYLKQHFPYKAFSAASSLICVLFFLLLSISTQSTPPLWCLSLYCVC